MVKIEDSRKQMFLQKLAKSGFKIWQEDSYLDAGKYTVMHIESVFDIIDLAIEWATINENVETIVFLNQIKQDIEKAIGREVEDEN